MKRHNIIYQTTNTINGKTYIGRHSTDNLDDGYLGSGKEFRRDLKLLGKDSFNRIVLFDFPTPEEMIAKEIELLTEEYVNRDDNYNLGSGQGGLFTHGEEARQKLREANTGFVTVKDKDGNTFRIPVDDPRYLSGELVYNFKGMTAVKDKDGNKFHVKIDDPRYLSGELVSIKTGTKQSAERVAKHNEFFKKYWADTGGHSEEAKEKCRVANVGKVNVKDSNGNELRISSDDPRIKSGELVVACKGSVWVNNKDLQKSRFVRPHKVQEFLDTGWELGLVYFNKQKRFWISNPISQISRQVTEDKLPEFFANGWESGRIPPENIGEKIKASRQPGSWMINLETGETRIILKPLVEDYILNGWILGRVNKIK